MLPCGLRKNPCLDNDLSLRCRPPMMLQVVAEDEHASYKTTTFYLPISIHARHLRWNAEAAAPRTPCIFLYSTTRNIAIGP